MDAAFAESMNSPCECDAIYLTRNDGNIYISLDGGDSFVLIFQPTNEDGTLVGEVRDYTGSSEPVGWLFCDGRAISRDTFEDLFDVIGTSFGVGNGTTTFNIPDLRGQVTAGLDDMGTATGAADRVTDSEADSIGGSLGEEDHTLIADEIPEHTHVYQRRNSTGGTDNGFDSSGTISNLTNVNTSAVGSDDPHNNMQPTVFLNKIIRH
jgi:microcystin-dependent protein